MANPFVYFSLILAAFTAFVLIGALVGFIARHYRWTQKTAGLVSLGVPLVLGLAIQITAVLTKESAINAKLPVPDWAAIPWILWLPASFVGVWLCGRIAFPGEDFTVQAASEEKPLSIR